MATQWQTFPVEFRGGLISNLSPLQQGINAVGSATILQNFEPSKEGGYKKVLGYTKFSPNVVPGVGAIKGVKVVNTTEVVAVRPDVSTGFSKYYIGSGTTWTLLGTSAAVGGKVRGISYNFGSGHKLMFVDGVNYPAILNDATNTLTFLSTPADIQGASHIEIYKQTVFLANGTNLIFSAPFSDTDFTAASGGGIINVGHEINGLIVFRDQLIIFSRNQIQRLVGNTSADFQLLPITDNIGCAYPDTIQEVGGDVMFLAPDGFRLLGATERIGDFGLELASAPIAKDALEFLNTSTEFSSLIFRNKAQYRVFASEVSTSVDSSSGLIASKFSDQGASRIEWATTKGFKVLCCDGRYLPTGNGGEVTVFANDDGYVYRMESGFSRDGANISAIFESPFMPITDPQKRKTLYKMALYIDTIGTFEIEANFLFDIVSTANYNRAVRAPTIVISNPTGLVYFYGSSGSVYGTATYGSDVDKVYDTPLIGSGKTFAFRIEDNSTNPTFTLDTAVFEFKEHDRQ